VGEDATDADATAFCTTAASIRSKLGAPEETTVHYAGVVVVAIVIATARCTQVATITELNQIKPLVLDRSVARLHLPEAFEV
jgi:hypothetical protein